MSGGCVRRKLPLATSAISGWNGTISRDCRMGFQPGQSTSCRDRPSITPQSTNVVYTQAGKTLRTCVRRQGRFDSASDQVADSVGEQVAISDRLWGQSHDRSVTAGRLGRIARCASVAQTFEAMQCRDGDAADSVARWPLAFRARDHQRPSEGPHHVLSIAPRNRLAHRAQSGQVRQPAGRRGTSQSHVPKPPYSLTARCHSSSNRP